MVVFTSFAGAAHNEYLQFLTEFGAVGFLFLPLFVLALALTWLYDKTEGLLAPFMAHSLFNLANLAYLLWFERHH